MRHSSVIWALALTLCVSGPLLAADGGFKFPDLNPFDGGKKPTTASVSDGSSWLPKVPSMPGFKSSSRSRPRKPSTVTRMTQGTKSFFSKTYDALTPWDNDKPRKPPTQMGIRRTKKEKESSFFSWMQSEPEKEIRTVNDFIELPRPHFDE